MVLENEHRRLPTIGDISGRGRPCPIVLANDKIDNPTIANGKNVTIVSFGDII